MSRLRRPENAPLSRLGIQLALLSWMNKKSGPLLMMFDCLKTGTSLRNAITTTQRIATKAGFDAKAISVMSPDQVNWPGDFTSNWRDEFEKVGKAALIRFLKTNRAPGSIPSKILFQPYHSKKQSVQTVLAEIKQTKPAAIAVYTQTQKKKTHLPAGFISSVISKAAVPVFVINAKSPALKSVKTIVFATDFSEIDRVAFGEALRFASDIGAKIVLVHVLPSLVSETMTSYAGITGGWRAFEDYLEVQQNEANQNAQAWVKRAAERGVTAKYEILNNSKSIWSGILKTVKRHTADLIVMTEKTGPWEAVFIGSTTRKIIDVSATAVMVIPSKVTP